jgi:hypothetical protein
LQARGAEEDSREHDELKGQKDLEAVHLPGVHRIWSAPRTAVEEAMKNHGHRLEEGVEDERPRCAVPDTDEHRAKGSTRREWDRYELPNGIQVITKPVDKVTASGANPRAADDRSIEVPAFVHER